MSKYQLKINVIRSDGKVTQIEGTSAIVCATNGDIPEDLREAGTPVVVLRCDTQADLAWNLAAIIGAVIAFDFDAYLMAQEMVPLFDFANLELHHKLDG